MANADLIGGTSSEPLPTGKVTVKMLFEADENKPGTGGKVRLWANDRQIAEDTMPRTVPVTFSSYVGMDISSDNGLVVDLEYEDRAPYAFTGTVKQVVFDPKPAIHADEHALHQHASLNALAQGVGA